MTLPDPKNLSPRQRRCLALAKEAHMVRTKNGWGHTPNRIVLDVAASVQALGLVKVDRTGRQPRLVLTGAGQQVQAVIEQRRAGA